MVGMITHASPLTIGTSDSHLPGAGPVDPISLSTSHSGPGPLADTMVRVLMGAGEMTRPWMSLEPSGPCKRAAQLILFCRTSPCCQPLACSSTSCHPCSSPLQTRAPPTRSPHSSWPRYFTTRLHLAESSAHVRSGPSFALGVNSPPPPPLQLTPASPLRGRARSGPLHYHLAQSRNRAVVAHRHGSIPDFSPTPPAVPPNPQPRAHRGDPG
jgi:hypothetical protein